MAKKKKPSPKRFLAARTDASVGAIERKIAKILKLPEGSVQLRLPTKKKARADKKIGALLRDWGW
jgi:hypothetical protein